MRNLQEQTTKVESIYKGKIIDVSIEHVTLPNGKEVPREIVRHPGAVAVFAVTAENRLLLVRQFRKPLDRTILEIPAGKLEKNEKLLDCAHRELKEETGYTAQTMEFVTSFYTSPGFADELLHIFEAKGLSLGEASPDEDEFVDLIEVSIDEAFAYIEKGAIHDAKTIFAVYYWQNQQLKKVAGNG
jgi:ADP-ribose pyrophosphatase